MSGDSDPYVRTYASVSIRGKQVFPEEISERLGIHPSSVRKIGEPKGFRGRNGVFEDNVWRYTSQEEVESRELRDHLHFLFSLLEPNKRVIIDLLERGMSIKIWVFWESGWYRVATGGPVLDTTILRRSRDLGIESIIFDVYFALEELPEPAGSEEVDSKDFH